MNKQLDQGCYRIDWMGRKHAFVRCIACFHELEDCRAVRMMAHLFLTHSSETKRIEK